ncbi:MAG: hypothetical protein IPM06_21150 [Rhizobiales bacterium]|nr:hypothetical protein [Hyphomicrobiales bacterium]
MVRPDAAQRYAEARNLLMDRNLDVSRYRTGIAVRNANGLIIDFDRREAEAMSIVLGQMASDMLAEKDAGK